VEGNWRINSYFLLFGRVEKEKEKKNEKLDIFNLDSPFFISLNRKKDKRK